MGERNADSRGKKIVFVSNCLLNANNKVQEFARYPGMFFEILTTLNRYGTPAIFTIMRASEDSAASLPSGRSTTSRTTA